MKIIFMGTPDFSVPSLEYLCKEGYNIPLVITQMDRPKGRGKKTLPTPIKAKALELGLNVYQPKIINSEESIERIRNISPDCIVVVAYGQILKEEILNMPAHGCLNIHASLLPKYRGAAPIHWAIIEGESETGITIMKMDGGLDTGNMLRTESIPIDRMDDLKSMHDKLSVLGARLIVETLKDLEYGTIIERAQDERLATYAPKIDKAIGKINWNKKGHNILNLIRGLRPWPSAYAVYQGKKIKIHKAKRIKKTIEKDMGIIIKATEEGIFVNCLDSCIVIEELQFPGKRRMKVEEYLRGNQLETDVLLN